MVLIVGIFELVLFVSLLFGSGLGIGVKIRVIVGVETGIVAFPSRL